MPMPSNLIDVPVLNGGRNLERRRAAAHGEVVELFRGFEVAFAKYVKTVPTYAVKVPFEYEVDTLEGMHIGRAGTYLAVGQDGEMYPIDAGIFENTYRLDENG